MMKKTLIHAGLTLATVSGLQAMAMVGDPLPDPIGFTQAQPSVPLQNLSDFDFQNIDGQVAVVVYHASW